MPFVRPSTRADSDSAGPLLASTTSADAKWTSGQEIQTLPVDPVPRAGKVAHARLSLKPLTGSSQLSFPRGVFTLWPIREGTATPTDGHPSIGLREMMVIEPSAQLTCFR
jgi:hypothetical protein